MSCLGPGYNPNPPRAWSRVQNQCSYNLDPPTAAFNPVTGQTYNFDDYQREKQMLLKGNILQYKKNSSTLTKKQRYSQIAKGLWTNRTKTWASQTQTSTNPNTASLQRVNYEIVPLVDPITDPFGCTVNFLKVGGTLLGNTIVDPCTDEIIQRTRVAQCNSSSASDVPGPEVILCWDPRVQTWYPRQNLTMNNSGDKWPVNYKLFKSANDLVSGTEVSANFFNIGYLIEDIYFPSSLNDFNIANIYLNSLIDKFNLNLPVYLDLSTKSTSTSKSIMNLEKTNEIIESNYQIPRAGIYIVKTVSDNAIIKLPERIENLSTVIVINKSELSINIVVSKDTQKIYNNWYSQEDNNIDIMPNSAAEFKFIIKTENRTDEGDWHGNVY